MRKQSTKTNVVIVSTQSFPYGEAATNRIISYAKVLAEDLRVKHISVTPNFICNPNNLSKGVYKGIEYEYATGNNDWNPDWSRWKKAYVIYKGKFNLFRLLSASKPSTVILVSRDSNLIRRMIWFSKLKRFKLVLERTELGDVSTEKSVTSILSLCSKVSGILTISKQITDFFNPIKDKVNLFYLPMSVDVDRFSKQKRFGTTPEKYFAMCSGNNWERDGAIDSINAYLEFRKTHPEYKLKIAGLLNDKTEYSKRFKEIVESNENNGVVYIGRLSSDAIPEFIMGATGILMTPHRDYASGGFPTKLGEYLASGVPVVCTSVSEIPDYLNSSNSFICKPNDMESIVKNMKNIVEYIPHSRKIGIEGKKVAETVFNVATHKKELIQFLLNK